MDNYFDKLTSKITKSSAALASHLWEVNDDKMAYNKMDKILKGLTGHGIESFKSICVQDLDYPMSVDLTNKSLNEQAASLFGVSRYYRFKRSMTGGFNRFQSPYFALVLREMLLDQGVLMLECVELVAGCDDWNDYGV